MRRSIPASRYIYVQSTDAASGLPLSTCAFPNTDFIAVDTEYAPPYYRTVNPGDTSAWPTSLTRSLRR